MTWFGNRVLIYTNVANQCATFAKSETKFYVRLLILSPQENVKLVQQLKFGFKRMID